MPRQVRIEYEGAAYHVIGFIEEARRAVRLFERGVSLEHIKADARLKFSQTNRTEVQRTPIAFGQVFGPLPA